MGPWTHGYRMGGHNRGAAGEVDAIGRQQLKRTQLGNSSSAQRAVWHQIAHVGE